MRESSVESVYATDHPRLWRALHAFTGDREVANDAAAEAYAQALRRGDALRDPAAWIWRSAFRIASGMMQQRSAMVAVPAFEDTGDATEPVVHLLECLGVLSAQQRAIVALRYVGGLDIAHIADALDTSANTIRVQLHRAHSKLRATLGADHGT